jgi:hypothetical protein
MQGYARVSPAGSSVPLKWSMGTDNGASKKPDSSIGVATTARPK